MTLDVLKVFLEFSRRGIIIQVADDKWGTLDFFADLSSSALMPTLTDLRVTLIDDVWDSSTFFSDAKDNFMAVDLVAGTLHSLTFLLPVF